MGWPSGLTGRAIWAPDGTSLTLISDRDGLARPYAWQLHGGRRRTAPAATYPRPVFATEWSRDGRWLLLRTDDQAPGKADILAVRPGIDSVARPLLASPDVAEYSPMLSPDGRWLAYVSNEDGRYEVRVTSFPEVRERWRISTEGGAEPAWSHDGRELYYIADDGFMMRAIVAPGAEFAVSSQQRLFATAPYARYGFFNRNYDVRAGRHLPDATVRRDQHVEPGGGARLGAIAAGADGSVGDQGPATMPPHPTTRITSAEARDCRFSVVSSRGSPTG